MKLYKGKEIVFILAYVKLNDSKILDLFKSDFNKVLNNRSDRNLGVIDFFIYKYIEGEPILTEITLDEVKMGDTVYKGIYGKIIRILDDYNVQIVYNKDKFRGKRVANEYIYDYKEIKL